MKIFMPLLAAALFSVAGANALPIPAGWTCSGSCGDLGADGVVTVSPNGGNYHYVSTSGGLGGVGVLPGGGLGGGEFNGSTLTTNAFVAAASDTLKFFFNYVTSDGAGFADYAWAALVDSSNVSTILFTARTIEAGDVVPGFGTVLAPGVTLTPATTGIIGGGPAWSPLGGSSGECFDAGCGYTGWIQSDYVIPVADTYTLVFGTTNWADDLFDSGLAIDGIVAGGVVVGGDVPEPSTFALLGLGTLALVVRARRKRA